MRAPPPSNHLQAAAALVGKPHVSHACGLWLPVSDMKISSSASGLTFLPLSSVIPLRQEALPWPSAQTLTWTLAGALSLLSSPPTEMLLPPSLVWVPPAHSHPCHTLCLPLLPFQALSTNSIYSDANHMLFLLVKERKHRRKRSLQKDLGSLSKAIQTILVLQTSSHR